MTSALAIIGVAASVLVCVPAHLFGIVVAGRFFGVNATEIRVFYGPVVRRCRLAGASIVLGSIPSGGSVRFDPDWQESTTPRQRCCIIIGGPTALLLLSAACLSAPVAASLFVSGFPQILSGALSPVGTGAKLMQGVACFVQENPFRVTLGATAAKCAAANLLPIPIVNGGQVLVEMYKSIRPLPLAAENLLTIGGILCVGALLVSWVIALVASFLLTSAA